MRAVMLPDGTGVPCLGQGTWYMGESAAEARREADALRQGLDLGMTLIDTAEMYADGGAERVVGGAIAGQREKVFLVSKVYPHNASRRGVVAACERSLSRLKTDRIELYLLHWRGGEALADTVAGFHALRDAGKIRHWGVSNFDVSDLEELPPGCVINQVLYNLEHRGIEFDLLPHCAGTMPIMAYSPVGQGGRLLKSPTLITIAARHDATPAQIALAWTLRHPGIISIPKAATPEHVAQNAAAAAIVLTEQDQAELNAAFPPPRRKQSLAML